jgi:hypothetical protein
MLTTNNSKLMKIDFSDVDICSLSPDPGNCKGACPRYYYNAKKKRCIPFSYGCCGGNANNFQTKALCKEVCGRGMYISINSQRTCTFLYHFYFFTLSESFALLELFENLIGAVHVFMIECPQMLTRIRIYVCIFFCNLMIVLSEWIYFIPSFVVRGIFRNGPVLRMRPKKTEVTCHSRCGTLLKGPERRA